VTEDSAESAFVNVVAEKLMEQTWSEISEAIDDVAGNDATAKDIKKRLADHLWCSMLLVLVRAIEGTNRAIDLLAHKTKETLKKAVGTRLEHGVAKAIADAVINVVVDKVLAALTDLVASHFPILGEKSLRAFRILTVLACPSVEKHPEVYEHAMKPLMDEGRAIATEQIKAWLTSLFTGWWRKKGLALAA
jgi:hypothetical protein